MAPVIDGKKTVFVSIMRAGAGFLDGMLKVVPGARIGHIGLYRDPKTLVAVEYYFKMPHDMHERDAIVLDPMLATGNSAVAAVDRLKETKPKSIRFVCLLAAPEGLANFHANHPDVPVYTAAIDRAAQRARLHRAGPGRRGRPPVRHQVAFSRPGRATSPRTGGSRCRPCTNRCHTKWPKRSDESNTKNAVPTR